MGAAGVDFGPRGGRLVGFLSALNLKTWINTSMKDWKIEVRCLELFFARCT